MCIHLNQKILQKDPRIRAINYGISTSRSWKSPMALQMALWEETCSKGRNRKMGHHMIKCLLNYGGQARQEYENAQGQGVWTMRCVYSDLKQNFVLSGPPTRSNLIFSITNMIHIENKVLLLPDLWKEVTYYAWNV